MRRLIPFLAVAALLLMTAARAEYCVNWSSALQKHAGFGHCWATEKECRAYYNSRSLTHPGDFAGGCYYRPGIHPQTAKPGTGNAKSPADNAAQQAQQKFKVQQQAEEAARQQGFERDQRQLLRDLKGGLSTEPADSRSITLKPFPAGTARQQLDCAAARGKASEKRPEERGGDWDNRGSCDQPVPEVPPVPAPQPVDGIQ